MPSIINSDSGAVTGSAGLKFAGSGDGILEIQNDGQTSLVISNQYIKLPSGNTASRPVTATAGMIRFNNESNVFEVFTGAAWTNLFFRQSENITIELLAVGGGGGGGGAAPNARGGGGGGGGGFFYSNTVPINTYTEYIYSTGAGGAGSPGSVQGQTVGGNTFINYLSNVFSPVSVSNYLVFSQGGGVGGRGGAPLLDKFGANVLFGGSGGGGGQAGGAGGIGTTVSYPYGTVLGNYGGSNTQNPATPSGGAGGGGGGAGGAGGSTGNTLPGTPGLGANSSITGIEMTYSAGGSGNYNTPARSAPGAFGSGTGGGGGAFPLGAGGNGGPGSLIISISNSYILTPNTTYIPNTEVRAGFNVYTMVDSGIFKIESIG